MSLLLLLLVAALAPAARPAALDLVTVAAPTAAESSAAPETSPPAVTSTPSASEASSSAAPARDGGGGRPEVYSLRVESRISHRYARTVVSSRLANRESHAQEAVFSLVLPENAFISAFSIETGGKVYEAYVREKEEAKKEYDQALAAGQTAGHVAVSARDSNTFNVAVNVAPNDKVTFNLTYEELLARQLGAYRHALHVTPGQVVRDLRVDVYIDESRNITELRTPAFRGTGDAEEAASVNAVGEDEEAAARALPGLTVERPAPGKAHISFAPSPDQQRAIARRVKDEAAAAAQAADADNPFRRRWRPNPPETPEGLSGQLVVQYDVERDPQGGEVLLDQGYFVHFFAPDTLPPLPKHVVFVLDVSGSMEGRKVQQLKAAMATILDDLKPGDYFNLLEFSYSVTVWNLDSASNNVVYSPYTPPPHFGDAVATSERPAGAGASTPVAYPATPEYIRKAKETVARMTAGGGTNIHDALKTALGVARDGLANVTLPADGPRPEPIVVFLTDGEPTVGESRPHKIFAMVSERNVDPTVALFSLAFGDDADLPFLKKLSLRNHGFARKIYEAADAELQLRNFYRQVASPLLSNVRFEYTGDAVDANATTKTHFPAYFAGSEFVVAGRLEGGGEAMTMLQGAVHGRSGDGEASFPLTSIPLPIPPWHLRRPEEEAPGSRRNAPSLERLWAYLSIRQLLDEREANSGFDDPTSSTPAPAPGDTQDPAPTTPAPQQAARDAAAVAKSRALELALRYSFVTSLTSLVVVKPNGTSAADLEGADAAARPSYAGAFGAPGMAGVPLSNYPVASFGGAARRPILGLAHKSRPALHMSKPVPLVDRIDTVDGIEAADTPALDDTASYDSSNAGGERGSQSLLRHVAGPGGGFGGASYFHQPLSAQAAGLPLPQPQPAMRPSWYPSTTFRPLATRRPDTTVAAESATVEEEAAAPTEVSASTPDASPAPTLPPPTLGTLNDLTWLTNSLNGTTGSLLVPLANGTHLYRLGVHENNEAFAACALPERADGLPSGPAHCRHLPYCVLPEIRQDVQQYIPYFCSIDDFAGVCCPDNAFPASA